MQYTEYTEYTVIYRFIDILSSAILALSLISIVFVLSVNYSFKK